MSFAWLWISWSVIGGPAEALPRDEPTVVRLLALGDGFRVHDTEHFSIVFDTPYESLRPLTVRLEGIYDAIDQFCRAGELQVHPPATRMPIVLFMRYEDFTAFAEKAGVPPGTAAGFYDQSTNVAAFCNTLDSPELRRVAEHLQSLEKRLEELTPGTDSPIVGETREGIINRMTALRAARDALVERFNRLVIQHEAAHQVLFGVGLHVRGAANPAWLVEGLACQFEVPQSDASGVAKRVNQMRLADLREALGAATSARHEADVDWRGVLAAGKLTPLADLVCAGDLVEHEPATAAARYGQAWALVYYLHLKHRPSFAAYVRRISTRMPGQPVTREQEIEDFEACFARLDDAFTRNWVTFILERRFEPAEAGR